VLRVIKTAFGDEGAQVGPMVEALDVSGNTRAGLVAEVDGGSSATSG
jgi:glyoxylate carboligase